MKKQQINESPEDSRSGDVSGGSYAHPHTLASVIQVLFLATAALVFWFYSIEMQRYSYHPVDYKNCKLIVLDSKKGVIYALKSTVVPLKNL